jgi:hypothetical protein
MGSSQSAGHRKRVLILIPGDVNYFYNLSGRRVAEALSVLGYEADVRTLQEWEPAAYDSCIVSNLAEVLFSYKDEAAGLALVREIRRSCRGAACLAIDCVSTPWYHRLHDFSLRADIDVLLDLGLYDQTPWLEPAHRANYRFLFSGLTPSEEVQLAEALADQEDRTLPWAFIGHNNPYRAALVDQILQTVSPDGFVYLPTVAPYTQKGSPHLNQRQYEAVLRRTRYQLWCSHHEHFYMEPERFRTSLLTGSVPIKVVGDSARVPKDAPFSYLMMEAAGLRSRLQPDLFPRVRQRFVRDFQAFPTLAQELASVLTEIGLSPRDLPVPYRRHAA